jgi:NAD(P)-dependent dehydrogenase (short-subunit alcohol dehydrogenase family)
MRLAGKTAIVTGAASGIGQAVAALFLREGAAVLGVDRNADGIPAGCQICVADVTDEAAANAAVAALGGVDVLVTAAGISLGKPAAETALADFEAVMAVNVTGTFLWLRACLGPMVEAGRGSIVTISSQLARAGGRGNAAYVASKGAVLALTRSVAVDYAAAGVRCNAVLPGAIDTPMLARSMARAPDPEAARARSRARHAMGRFGRAGEVAQSVLHLASDESGFVTGIEMPVDGGWLAA